MLANYKRLQILALLARQRVLTVAEAARQAKLSLPTASQYLRALEARGFLSCRRVGRQVEYRLVDGRDDTPADRIVAALRPSLVRRGIRLERVFKTATAFTHPRRIEIFRAIATGAGSFVKIQAATRISILALQRQLEKLEARGFITCVDGVYSALTQADPFARALVLEAVLERFGESDGGDRTGNEGDADRLELSPAAVPALAAALPSRFTRSATRWRE